MIPYSKMRAAIAKGLKDYLGVPVIRGNQTAPRPPYPFVAYNVTTIAGQNGGSWQEHEDADRKLVRSIWSITALSKDWDESVNLAIKARQWFEHTGRAALSDQGFTVQSTTDITNRDNILTVEYERMNGFDVFFYVYDEAERISDINGHIETADITREETN